MEEINRILFPVNCVRLCINCYSADSCSGKICGVALEKEIPFFSMTEMIVKIDEAFDAIGQPQPHQVLRSFKLAKPYQPYQSKPVQFNSSEEIAIREGKYKTFDLIMLSRRRTEWQGILKQPSGWVLGRFGTIMECIKLFENNLQQD